MKKYLISVIVPIYNVEKYLRKCLDSIIYQTYRNLEIILVNDGSTDNSGSICEEYAQADDRIKVIHKTNGGQCSARNMGLDVCTGDYITFVDSDDWIDKDYYEKMILQVGKGQLDCCVSDRKVFNEEYVEIYNTNFAKDSIYTVDNVQNYFLAKFFKYTPSVCNKLYKRECINNIRFKDIRKYGSEDFIFNFEVLFNLKQIGEISNTYNNNLARKGSTARRYTVGEIQQNVNLFNICINIAKIHGQYDKRMQAILLYVFYFFYSRSINHIKEYCLIDSGKVLHKEIDSVYDFLKQISKLILKNREVNNIFKAYGFRIRGILTIKMQFFLYLLTFKKVSIAYCKKINRING